MHALLLLAANVGLILLDCFAFTCLAHGHVYISSVESQKGVITVQRCSVENQKGAITMILYQDSAL